MALIANPQHAITLGGLPLVTAGKPVTHSAGFTTEVSANGTTWGNPSVAVSTLISQLTDGDSVQQDHVGNREPVLYVRITANTHAGLIAGDAALGAVVGEPCELTWTPPGPGSPTTVIDSVHSRMDHQWDDMDSRRYTRVWMVTMSALPWPRSANKIVTPAVTAAAPTTMDSGSATTNWTVTSPAGASLSVVSGALTSTYNPSTASVGGFYGTTVVRAFPSALNTSAAKYIAVDWKTSLNVLHAFRTSASTVNMTEVRREPGATGYTRSWYKLADTVASISNLTFGVVHPSNAAASATLSIDQVLLANELPASGTTRQKVATVFAGGSVPAEGSVLIQHPSSSLGKVIAFSHPAGGGYTPPLRQWLYSSSTATPNAAWVSGSNNPLDTITEFRVPYSALPEGPTQLWILAGCSHVTAVSLSWSIYGGPSAQTIPGAVYQGTTLLNFPAAFSYYLFPIAAIPLPVTKVGPSGVTRIEIQAGNATNPVVYLDEAWLFATEKGRLTILDAGNGTPSVAGSANRVRIAAPSLEEPNGSIMIGTAADWSDAYTPGSAAVICDQVGHRFDPEGSVVFTVTSNATDAAVSLEHYRRWRAEAGD